MQRAIPSPTLPFSRGGSDRWFKFIGISTSVNQFRSPQYRVRHEARAVLGDRRTVLSDADPARLLADDPTADHRETAGVGRQLCQGLPNETLAAIGTVVAVEHACSIDQHDVAAFAGIERLPGIAALELLARRIVLEIGGQ